MKWKLPFLKKKNRDTENEDPYYSQVHHTKPLITSTSSPLQDYFRFGEECESNKGRYDNLSTNQKAAHGFHSVYNLRSPNLSVTIPSVVSDDHISSNLTAGAGNTGPSSGQSFSLSTLQTETSQRTNDLMAFCPNCNAVVQPIIKPRSHTTDADRWISNSTLNGEDSKVASNAKLRAPIEEGGAGGGTSITDSGISESHTRSEVSNATRDSRCIQIASNFPKSASQNFQSRKNRFINSNSQNSISASSVTKPTTTIDSDDSYSESVDDIGRKKRRRRKGKNSRVNSNSSLSSGKKMPVVKDFDPVDLRESIIDEQIEETSLKRTIEKNSQTLERSGSNNFGSMSSFKLPEFDHFAGQGIETALDRQAYDPPFREMRPPNSQYCPLSTNEAQHISSLTPSDNMSRQHYDSKPTNFHPPPSFSLNQSCVNGGLYSTPIIDQWSSSHRPMIQRSTIYQADSLEDLRIKLREKIHKLRVEKQELERKFSRASITEALVNQEVEDYHHHMYSVISSSQKSLTSRNVNNTYRSEFSYLTPLATGAGFLPERSSLINTSCRVELQSPPNFFEPHQSVYNSRCCAYTKNVMYDNNSDNLSLNFVSNSASELDFNPSQSVNRNSSAATDMLAGVNPLMLREAVSRTQESIHAINNATSPFSFYQGKQSDVYF